MHPEQIKAEIRMRGTTPSAIADELGVSRSTVSQVIHGRGISSRITGRICELLEMTEAAIWPNKLPTLVRRNNKQSTPQDRNLPRTKSAKSI